MKRYCSYATCGLRRRHHEDQDTPRGTQEVEVPDDHPEGYPTYCSITCAVSDGYLTLRYETKEEQEARQAAWRAERAKK